MPFRSFEEHLDSLPSLPDGVAPETDTRLSALLNDLGISLIPDSTVQDEGLVYLLNTCPEQPVIRVVDIQSEKADELPGMQSPAKKRRRRVVVNKKRHSEKLNLSNSSSTFDSSFSSSSSLHSPPSRKNKTSGRQVDILLFVIIYAWQIIKHLNSLFIFM